MQSGILATPRPILNLRVRQKASAGSAWRLVLQLLPLLVLVGLIGVNNTAVQMFALLGIAALVFMEPRLGLYAIMATIAVDAMPQDPLTAQFVRLNQGIPGMMATPIELLVLWTCVARFARGFPLSLPGTTELVASVALTVVLVMTTINGLANGGNLTIALWETRGLLMVLPVLLLTTSLVTNRQQLFELLGVITGSLALMTLEMTWRYLTVLRPGDFGGVLEQAFNHDGAMLVAALSIISGASFLWSSRPKYRIGSMLLMLLSVYVVLVARRRAAVIGAESGLLVLGIMLALTHWGRFSRWFPFVLIVAVLYASAFWNNQNTLGQPVRGFRSVFQSQQLSERDRQSDDYRIAERYNAWANIRARPVLGSGFGLAYSKPVPLTDLSNIWPFWAYIPHNSILWLWMKGGIPLFIAFWFLLGSSCAQGVHLAKRLKEPLPIAIAASICAYFVMVVLMAYVDLGLQSARLMILFGCSLGLLSVLDRLWSGATPANGPSVKA